MTALIIVLRILHILAGVFWVGGVLAVSLFVLPSVQAAGPAGPAFMKQLVQVRRLPDRLLGAGVVTILAGLALYWIDARNSLGAFQQSRFGMVTGIGAVLAIIAASIGGFVSKPTAVKLGRIGAEVQASGGPPSAQQAAEIAQLQAKLAKAALAVAVLLVFTVLCMAIARYL